MGARRWQAITIGIGALVLIVAVGLLALVGWSAFRASSALQAMSGANDARTVELWLAVVAVAGSLAGTAYYLVDGVVGSVRAVLLSRRVDGLLHVLMDVEEKLGDSIEELPSEEPRTLADAYDRAIEARPDLAKRVRGA
ncbi:MAG TPA: hypothetical protein VL463_27135 [Kofleriaceae bacterium]|jgi:hypothetical protein|nr:hypothetical protein [Kofleriaceae bacterium]